MASIIEEAEGHYERWGHYKNLPENSIESDAVSITRAARELAHDRDVAAIAVFTISGVTALYMAKARPRVPILAFTPERKTYHRMGVYWGVEPFLVPFASTIEAMLAHVESAMVASSDIRPGQQIVMITGFPVGTARVPNFALLHTIGSKIQG